MSNPPDEAPSSFERCLHVLSYLLRVPLGLFVLWQALFLFGYNVVDAADSAHGWLSGMHDKWQRQVTPSDEMNRYQRLIALPRLGSYVADWAANGDKSDIGRALVVPKDVVEWWARRTGQEQGWGLFSPDTYTATCFVSVELRWDDEDEPAGPDTPSPVVIVSENQPDDIRRFVRFGGYRTRRCESKLETYLYRNADESRAEVASDWDDRIRRKKKDQGDYMIVFLKWKLRKFQEAHPGVPTPRQVILRTQTWSIPAAGEVDPWDWRANNDLPEYVARWRPLVYPEAVEGNLEEYIHAEKRFAKWNQKPMPMSKD